MREFLASRQFKALDTAFRRPFINLIHKFDLEHKGAFSTEFIDVGGVRDILEIAGYSSSGSKFLYWIKLSIPLLELK